MFSRKLCVAFILQLFLIALAGADERFGDSIIREEQGRSEGTYIAPNEYSPHVYSEVIEQSKGALISVGTFRTLDRSAAGDFEHVFLLDYDEKATEFNRLNIELLKKAKDRYDYLEMLLGRKSDPKTLAEARSGKLHDALYINELLTKGTLLFTSGFEPQLKMQRLLDSPTKNKGYKNLREMLGYAITRVVNRSDWAGGSLIGSDYIFQTVQKMAREGRYTAINGSLTGDDTLRTLGTALKRKGVQVSVVDLSNAVDHIQMFSKVTGWAIKGLARNLRALPLAKNARILFTAYAHWFGFREPASDPWGYLALTKEQFFRAIELGHLDTTYSYEKYAQEIYKNRIEPRDYINERLIVPTPSFEIKEKAAFVTDWCKSKYDRLMTDVHLKAYNYLHKRFL